MKKLSLHTLGAATCALLLSSAVAGAGIINTPHDFSAEQWNVQPSDKNSVCGPCHQPHNASSYIIPLWGHATSIGPWTMYNTTTVTNSSMKAVPDANPTGVSLACLSCHDGTVAVNEYGGQVQGGVGVTITNSAKIGTDLTHTHPICFTYDTTLIGLDTGLQNPDTVDILVPENSPNFVTGPSKKITDFLLNGTHRVECSSCHDVHNSIGSPFDINSNPKLVKIVGTQGGKGSLLCRSCHIK